MAINRKEYFNILVSAGLFLIGIIIANILAAIKGYTSLYNVIVGIFIVVSYYIAGFLIIKTHINKEGKLGILIKSVIGAVIVFIVSIIFVPFEFAQAGLTFGFAASWFFIAFGTYIWIYLIGTFFNANSFLVKGLLGSFGFASFHTISNGIVVGFSNLSIGWVAIVDIVYGIFLSLAILSIEDASGIIDILKKHFNIQIDIGNNE